MKQVSIDVVLESTTADNWTNELSVLFDPTPATPGGDGVLEFYGWLNLGSTEAVQWDGGGGGEGTPLIDDKYAITDFTSFDMSTTEVFLVNTYGDAGAKPPNGGTWSGTITLTYGAIPRDMIWTGLDATSPTEWSISTTVLNWDDGAAPSAFGDGDAAVFDDTVTGSTTVDISGADIAPAAVTFNNSAATYTLTGTNAITGSAGLTKSNDGLLIVNNVNTYSGLTNISGGTVRLGVDDALPHGAGKGNAIVEGTLDLNGHSQTLNGFSGAGTVTSGASGDVTLTVGDNDRTGTFTGLIEDGSGGGTVGLDKVGDGEQTLSGANTFTGGVTLNSGTLNLTNNNAIGTNTLTINGGTVGVNNNFTFPNNPFVINGDCTFYVPNAQSIYFGSGQVTLGNNAIVTLQLGQSPNLSNNWTDNGGGYNLTLINTQDGGTTISGNINTSGGLTLKNDVSGNSKNLTISGTGSTFTGPTILLGGGNNAIETRNLSNAGVAGSLGMPTGANAIIQAYNDAIWRPRGTTDRGLNLASDGAGTVTINPYNGNATIGSNTAYGAITATGTGAKTLRLNMPWNNVAHLTINGAISDCADGSPLTLQYYPGYTGVNDGNFASVFLTGVNTFTGPIDYEDVASAGKFCSALNITEAGQLGAGNYANTISMNTTPWAIFNYASSADQILSGEISGAGKLIMSGTGKLTLTAHNTYTGITTVSGGTLNLGASETAGISGPLGAQAATAADTIILSGGTLQYSTSNQFDYSGRFSTGASQQYNVDTNGQDVTWITNLTSSGGSLTKTGAGTLTLSGVNTCTGPTAVNDGKLVVNSETGLGGTTGGAVSVAGDATLALGGDVTATYAGPVTMSAGAIYECAIRSSTTADKVEVTGNLTLDDDWKLKLVDIGFAPTVSQEYDLFTYTTYTGLASFGPSNIDAGETGWIVSDANIVVDSGRIYIIGLSALVTGDTNGDLVVDAADFIALKQNFGMESGAGSGEGDVEGEGDGDVDWDDLSFLMTNMSIPGSALSMTPEPATLFVMMAAGLPALLKRRRRVRS